MGNEWQEKIAQFEVWVKLYQEQLAMNNENISVDYWEGKISGLKMAIEALKGGENT